jgi:hypothetical protein
MSCGLKYGPSSARRRARPTGALGVPSPALAVTAWLDEQRLRANLAHSSAPKVQVRRTRPTSSVRRMVCG